MKRHSGLLVSLIIGAALGAGAVQALHAAATPPGFVVAEIDVTNADAYQKEYAPLTKQILVGGGGTYLVRGGKTTGIDGEPPKNRIAIVQFESVDKALAVYNSQAYRDARKIGEKYAKFRVYAVEGVTP